MADWRQIQARIRKAKTSVNPSAKLSELYLRTHDAMVAWELGAFEEKNGRTDEAVKWYTTAAQRFRRAEWKKKAQEALARLGVETPTAPEAPSAETASPSAATPAEPSEELAQEVLTEASAPPREGIDEPQPPLAPGEIPETEVSALEVAPETGPPPSAGSPGDGRKKRRRGRRGGRGRHRKGTASPSLPARAFSGPSGAAPTATPQPPASPVRAIDKAVAYPVSAESEEEQPHARPGREEPAELQRVESPRVARPEHPAPQLPSERAAHGRAGDPALASRMAQLESMLRRLLSSRLHRLDELDEAPAGPGVFLLSDSDQVTSYYVESCQTLRIGLGNLTRSGRGGKTHHTGGRTYSEIDIKGKFADHLGISQSKVSQYMKDHCVVRWIQLDEEAPHLAHFAIGVLRTPLNLE
jgi:hypothetical protein